MMFVAGLLGVALAFLFSPSLVARYFSMDHQLTPEGVRKLMGYRTILLLVSGVILCCGYRIKKYQRIIIRNNTIAFCFGLLAWAILYVLYLSYHNFPVNPAGYYLESARQLIQNDFRIPAYLKGFGIPGIPFAYPPLGFYVYALGAKILGDIPEVALILPGLLLPIQAWAGYLFVKQFTGSEQAAQWAGVFLLLIPHLFYRTLFGDGITTGLSGIFLLLSWYFAVKADPGAKDYRSALLGGIFVGLSVLSHPGIGLFCVVTFTILFVVHAGWQWYTFWGVALAGITVFILTFLLWLLPVISFHGIEPLLASVRDKKSPFYLFANFTNTISYSYGNHLGDERETLFMVLFPLGISVLYSLVRGPRVVFLLFLSSLFTFRGHPSVTMFVFALCLGVFYRDISQMIIVPLPGKFSSNEQNENSVFVVESLPFVVFSLLHVLLLSVLCWDYVFMNALDKGEMQTYLWIRSNTKADATFIIEGIDENLVYFAERTILLPTLGAEWIPDSDFGNALQRNSPIVQSFFSCRDINCVIEIMNQYNLKPDYVVYRVSSEEEKDFIEALHVSDKFELVFSSGKMYVLQYEEAFHLK